jgi:hypothetical protein
MAIINSDDTRTVLDRLARRGLFRDGDQHDGRLSARGQHDDLSAAWRTTQVDEVVGVFPRKLSRAGCSTCTPLPPVMEPGEVHIPTPVEKQVGGARPSSCWSVARFEKI